MTRWTRNLSGTVANRAGRWGWLVTQRDALAVASSARDTSNAFTGFALFLHLPKVAKTANKLICHDESDFIPPMLLFRREKLPEGSDWGYESKHAGYRYRLRRWRRTSRYPTLLKGLEGLGNENTGCWI